MSALGSTTRRWESPKGMSLFGLDPMRTKRRNALKNARNQGKPRSNVGASSINKWKRREDIELDEQDAFHENRDKILLEGEENDISDDDLGNEVFGLKGLPQDQDSEQEFEEGPDETDEGEIEDKVPSKLKKATKESKKKSNARTSPTPSSSDQSEEIQESWGRKKSAYYSTNAKDIDSDDEEAQKLEEAEVLRLQAEARSGLDEGDFGLLDAPRTLVSPAIPDAPSVATVLPQEPAALVRHLEKTSPETLALAREWEDVVFDLARSQQAIKEQDAEASASPAAGMLQLYHQTLLTYATTLAFYLHMRADRKYASNPSLLQDHPILSRLLTLKQAMSSLEKLDFGPDSTGGEDEFDSEDYEDDMQDLWGNQSLAEMDEDEFLALVQEARQINEKATAASQGDNEEDLISPPAKKEKKKRSKDKEAKKAKKQKETQPVFDLQEPEFVSASKRRPSAKAMVSTNITAYGERTSLDNVDALDKSARKKSLQFHTSKIESSSARRAKARGAAMGGDDDIPYREREKERELRLQRENAAKVKKLGQSGEDLEDAEDEPRVGKKRSREDNDGDTSHAEVDGYYDLVKRQKKEKKEESKAHYEAERAAERALREGDLDSAADGPRSLTRAILKNKGLTPTRSKSVRNPRVKKRMKYDEAKKKLKSQKAIFKGGLANTGGRYEGETSGISSKVVKSVRLG